MNKKSLIALTVGACTALPFSIATAATNADCIEIGLTGGWFTAFPTSRDYAVPARLSAPVVGLVNNPFANGSVNAAEPKYRFGGGVSLAYQPCGQPFIWGVSWFGITKKRVSDNAGLSIISVPRLRSNTTASSVSDSLGTRYNFATATLATLQGLCCDTVHVKPHLGVAYLDIKDDRTLTMSTLNLTAFPPTSGGNVTINESSRFYGFGPDLGIDLKYCFCGGFSLYGNLDYSALIGKNKGSYNNSSRESVSWSSSRANHVVSHIQTEIAIGYNFGFCGCDRGDLLLGYRVTKIFDPAARFDTPLLYDNANLHGPFLRLNWGFNL